MVMKASSKILISNALNFSRFLHKTTKRLQKTTTFVMLLMVLFPLLSLTFCSPSTFIVLHCRFGMTGVKPWQIFFVCFNCPFKWFGIQLNLLHGLEKKSLCHLCVRNSKSIARKVPLLILRGISLILLRFSCDSRSMPFYLFE